MKRVSRRVDRSGSLDELPVDSPRPLNLRPQDWPEADHVLALAWDRLDEVMARKRLPADVRFKAS